MARFQELRSAGPSISQEDVERLRGFRPVLTNTAACVLFALRYPKKTIEVFMSQAG